MLEIKDIHKEFKNFKVLNGCNLKIEDGHVFGLVGINGAGKSTLLRCIAGVYESDEGEVLFDNEIIKDNPEIRKDILLISDEPYFTKTMTINDLKEFYETFYNFDTEAYYKYLNMFGLDPNKTLNSFSKGMKRQSFLIIALSIKPRLLLLDEAFDGLDPLTRLDFRKALAELIEDKNITVIISSHNLKELEDICDSYGLLENGVIKTSGDLANSIDNINKYQLVFDQEKDLDIFKEFNILNSNKSGRVLTLVIKGDKDEIYSKLLEFQPMIIDVLKVDFEELFIYEVETRGSIHE